MSRKTPAAMTERNPSRKSNNDFCSSVNDISIWLLQNLNKDFNALR
ncbi:21_t:CDS:1, partial [Ambispora gerdemannii]